MSAAGCLHVWRRDAPYKFEIGGVLLGRPVLMQVAEFFDGATWRLTIFDGKSLEVDGIVIAETGGDPGSMSLEFALSQIGRHFEVSAEILMGILSNAEPIMECRSCDKADAMVAE